MARPSRTLLIAAVGTAVVGATLVNAPAAPAEGAAATGRSAVGTAATWGPERQVPMGYLARSTSGATTLLHAVPKNDTEHLNYYVSADGGSSWSPPRRYNRAGQLALAAGVATAGSRVYLAWSVDEVVTRTDREEYTAVYVKTNTSNGSIHAWLTRRKLPVITRATAIAAAGSTVLVTGVRGSRSYVVASHDKGRTWIARHVATPSRGYLSSVVASGRNALVIMRTSRHMWVRVSRDRGRTWSRSRAMGQPWGASAAALGDRLVVMAPTAAGAVSVRTWRSGSWGSPRPVPTRSSTLDPHPLVALRGRSDIGILWTWRSTRVVDNGWFDMEVLWRQSSNGGRTWSAYEKVNTQPGPKVATNVMWRSTGQIYAAWDRLTSDGYTGTLRIRG